MTRDEWFDYWRKKCDALLRKYAYTYPHKPDNIDYTVTVPTRNEQ